MKRLTALSLVGVSLNWLSFSSLKKLQNLKYFDASFNNIQYETVKCKKSIQDMENRKHSNIAKSSFHDTTGCKLKSQHLEQASKEIFLNSNCISLNILNLSQNAITSLTQHLQFLNQACVIDVSRNRISHI